MDRGYFALWRKVQDHPFYKEPRVFSKYEAWIDLLMNAQWKREPKNVLIGMVNLTQKYGETLKSTRTWGKRWGWGTAKVHRFLKLLKNMGQIDTQSETVTTRICIINFERYDPRHINSETQVERKRNTCETQAERESTTNKNSIRKVKKDKKGKIYIPENFTLTEKLVEYAISHNIDPGKVDELCKAFADYHTDKETLAKSWDRSWYTWVRNAPEFSKWAIKKPGPQSVSSKTENNIAVLKGG